MRGRNVMSLTGAGLMSLFLLGAEVFLAIRFVLHFFAVSPTNGFAAWVFNSTNGLTAPFRGLFTATSVTPGHPHYVDLQVLFIMAVYAVVVAVLTWILGWANSEAVAVRRKK